jgi:hypothetical protein
MKARLIEYLFIWVATEKEDLVAVPRSTLKNFSRCNIFRVDYSVEWHEFLAFISTSKNVIKQKFLVNHT